MDAKKRVLLIDDDPRFRAVTVCALRDVDCSIFQAQNIHEGEVELSAGVFDLIILDGDLPDGNGISWLTRVRDEGITTPVVFVSAFTRDSLSYIQLRNELGVCLVLHKPVSIEVFKSEIGRVLDLAVTTRTEDQDQARRLSEDLSVLAAEYLNELPDRLCLLSGLLQKAERLPVDVDVMVAATREAHMLRGTAGLFGLTEVGQSMGLIEDTLHKIANSTDADELNVSWEVIASAMLLAAEQTLAPSAVRAEQSLTSAVCLAKSADEYQRSDRIRVLLIDDDRTFTRRAEAILSAHGILVYSFLDADHVEYLLNEVKPDLLLLDLNMQGRNGMDICVSVRADQRWTQLPILMVTGAPSVETKLASRKAGATAYLSKSAVNMELLDLVNWHTCKSAAIVPPPVCASQSNISGRVAS